MSVIDADLIAHDVVEPGQPALRTLRDAFGDALLNPEGRLDRAFMAEVVFHDPTALRRLNLITHGYIAAEISRQLDVAGDHATFIALPLFRPEHRLLFDVDEVWAVQVEPDTAVERLVGHRGFREADARARLSSQMTNEQRAQLVDQVIPNEGTLEELYEHLERLLVECGAVNG